MAEFKLGRIKFVWKGAWADSTAYLVDDAISYNGKSYMCVVSHTSDSSSFETDLNAVTPKWQLAADGSNWEGNWATSTFYPVGSQVKYGGQVYLCKTAHTSAATTTLGLEADQAKWDLFASSFYWAGAWATSTRYRVNDFVTYGGISYVCNTSHTSAATATLGLENDQSKWDVLNAGINYIGAWSGSSVRYKVNDVVKFGADLWICTGAHTSTGTSIDLANFDVFVSGFEFLNSWNASTEYAEGDTVTYGGYTYIALQNHTNKTPSTEPTYWTPFTTGFNFRGEWSGATQYLIGDVVRHGGYTYLANSDSLNSTPPSSKWERLNSGVRFVNTTASYTGVTTTNVTVSNGSASGAEFTVARSNTVYTLTRTANGTNYTTGDVIKILGTAVGGQTPANDITITVTASAGAITAQTHTGVAVTWTTGTAYLAGDAVQFGANTYICILAHTASSGNRPDADTTGTYWNLLTAGAESNALTTTGDTYYYSSTGPARLPVGNEGQVLRVSGGLPSWGYFGQVNNLIYVSATGTDRADFGITPENPLKTVRYAAKLIEDGYLNQNATALLAKNKQFAIKEVNNYLQYTYRTTITGTSGGEFTTADTSKLVVNTPITFTNQTGSLTLSSSAISSSTVYYVKAITTDTSFTVSATAGGTALTAGGTGSATGQYYVDQTKAERDAGFVYDAIVHDLGHNGTWKSTAAVQAYYTAAGTSYITAQTGYQITQFAAGQTYLKTLIQKILANTAPSSNYQTLNSVSPTANQIIDTTLTAESGAVTTTDSLMNLVITGITAGSTTSLAAPVFPNTTISIKTGTYNEVLPIVLPSNTAVVGDELRSTVIQPKAANSLLSGDKAKTTAALNRIKAVIPDLIANTSISATSGNTQTQVTTLPAGSAGSTAASVAVAASAGVMNTIVAGGLSTVPSFTYTNPTGYNTSYLAGFGDGKAQIVQNYQFIKDEISAYLNTYYNSVWVALGAGGQANCTRDVGYMLDAVVYDMTYGCNTQSLIAGSAYYSFGVSTIASYERTATIDAYKRLTEVINYVVQKNTSWTKSTGNVTSQVTTGTAGSAASAYFASARIQDINSWVTAGSEQTTASVFTGSTSSTTLTVTAITSGTITAGSALTGGAIANGTYINTQLTATNAAAATTTASASLGATSITVASATGIVAGQLITAAGIPSGTFVRSDYTSGTTVYLVTSYGSPVQTTGALSTTSISFYTAGNTGTYQISVSQAQTSTTLTGVLAITPVVSGAYSLATAGLQTAWTALQARKTEIQSDAVVWVQKFYQNVNFSTSTTSPCYRDAGLIVDALGWDMVLGSNFNAITVGRSYYRVPAAVVLASQKNAEIGAIQFIGYKAKMVASSGAAAQITQAIDDIKEYINGTTSITCTATTASTNVVTTSSTANLVLGMPIVFTGTVAGGIVANQTYYVLAIPSSTTFTLTSVSGGTTALTLTTTTSQSFTGTQTSLQTHGTVTYDNTLATIKGAEILRANKNFLAYEASAYITATYTYTVTTTTASTDRFTTSAPHAFVVGDPVVFSGTPFAGSGVTAGTVYYVVSTPTSSTFTVSETQGGTTINISADGSGTFTVAYSFDAVSCRRDAAAFVDAMVYDLQYTGNYKSLRAAQLYVNAINGSKLENMFLVRNGTGVRNMTLQGLSGTLTVANSYGTKRPTAGAYVSLDPGFGPNDTNVWITTRSCYSQNVTMFGTGCTGGKIDGALHAGGNRSTVANDFTTIISDGIGVWCTGANSLTELVSVFNYYGYAGYLAELGGRIRATNGNSSYGTYGVIAEGTDTYETPINATVTNRANQALVGNVVTDSVNKVWRFEYTNAGNAYSNTVHTISGSGYNAAATADEFRDAAIFETRLIDLNDSNGVGGTNYVTQSNAAQTGTVGEITIAATDTALSTAYTGMRIQLIAGTGVGQYANILTYSNGNKVAKVYKDSFTNLTVTATTASADTLTVASTATLYANMPIYLGTAVGGASANTVYYVKTIASSTTFTISTSSGGSTFDITSDTSGQTVTLYAAGWDHVVPGTTVANVLDLTTTYIIEPRISYTGPGFTSTARTLPATATWQAATYTYGQFLAIANGSTSTAYSADGKTWASAGALTTTSYVDVAFGGGEGAVATAVVGGLGGTGAVLTAALGPGGVGQVQTDQVATVTVVNGGTGYTTPPTIVFSGGGGSNAVATCTVLNGSIATVTVTVNGSSYTSAPSVSAATDRVTQINIVTRGKNYLTAPTVTLSGGGSTNQATGTAVLTNSGVSSITIGNSGGSGYTSTPTVTILDSSARYLAISGSAVNSCYQTVAGAIAGSAWTAGTSTSKTDLKSLAYGQVGGVGIWIAVGGTAGTASAVSSVDGGTTWIDRSGAITALSAGYYSAVAFGNGYFVAINSSGNKTSYMTGNPATWTAGGTLPATTTWNSLAYGNGRFVALSTNGTVAVSVDNAATWSAVDTATGATTSVLSSSLTWSTVRYGQGLFVAIAQGTQTCATSPDGINWTVYSTGMPSSSNWKALTFGNPLSATLGAQPLWVAASNTSGTAAASIRTGAKALGRMKAVAGVISEVRMVEPGSGYPKGAVTATTASTNVITTDDTTNLVDSMPIVFTGATTGGLANNTVYYVIGATIVTNTSFKVATAAGSSTPVTLTTTTGLTGTYRAGPIITQTDPNKTKTAAMWPRNGDGALGNPSFSNRGSGNITATAATVGDGYSDLFQTGTYINVAGLYSQPTAGANVQFASIPNVWYKLVSVVNLLGVAGNYSASFQINPALTTLNAPPHGDAVTTRLKYSQVRLTGHDFLYIGTGNQSQTNYPYVNPNSAIQANQTNSSGGGRVFFTSTDQDGNFNVGNLFGVQQATGTATLNANAFNLSGLQSLQLGSVSLGVGSAVITQFSTDPYFTANSDNVVPTQRAIKSYISSQIGGGASTLNVNTLTAGVIYLSGNNISTTTGVQINVTAKMNFVGGIDGTPVALAFFMQK